ncbi:MAG: ABC transporter ATP-binding protein [Verrucomicrobiales bacterium]|nr:ABC transporter ATP-binding protein [Verrucomicrobiales bacterium]MCP5556420.1 ABC transporter ATP-binding protein [Verrucomicrobiaceae bacterium]
MVTEASIESPAASPPPLPQAFVEVRNLSRRFQNVHAVNGVTFDIYPGQVVGFIGANGAGKTTTMRMMASLDSPDAGYVTIAGHRVSRKPAEVRKLIGWMPDSYGTYPNMTVLDYLDFFARAYGLKGSARRERIAEVMDFADLTSLADRQMGKLSKGMGQRLCFGRMLLPDPEFLIMDEPAAGLDPKARIEFKNLVRILAERGKTIFISSHILSELGEMCDTLLFIDSGKLVYHGGAEDLRRGDLQQQSLLDVTVLGDAAPLISWAEMHPGWKVVDQRRNGARLTLDAMDDVTVAAGLRQMIADGIQVLEFHRVERKLEDAFVDILRNQSAPLPGA